jgi:hypothetical protein
LEYLPNYQISTFDRVAMAGAEAYIKTELFEWFVKCSTDAGTITAHITGAGNAPIW